MNTFRYIDVLKDLVESYNHTYHQSIGMKLVELDEENSYTVLRKLFPINRRKRKPKFKVGDYVRISRKKRLFEKEHAPTWTEEVFKVKKVNERTTPITYIIENLLGDVLSEKFYSQQLQKVELPTAFVIEKVHRKRTRGKKKEVLVSWRGYPSQFMQWIPLEDILEIPHSI